MNPKTLQRLQQQYMRLQGRNDLRPSQQQKLGRITQRLGAQNTTGNGPGMQPPLSPHNVPQYVVDALTGERAVSNPYVVEGRPYRPYPNDPYQPGMEPPLNPPSPQFEQVQQPALLGQPMPNPYVVEGRPYRPYPNDPYQPGMEPMPNPYGTTTQQDIMGGGGTGTPFGQVLGQLGMGGMGGMPTQQTPLPQAPNSTGAGAGGAGLGAAFNQMFGR